MSGVRRAALHLHGLGKADREWLLAQLTQVQQDELAPLLDELLLLGIPALTDFDAIEGEPGLERPLTGVKTEDHPDVVMCLVEAAPPDVVAILMDEPDDVLIALLRLRDWPWQEAVLKSLPRLRREAIEVAVRAPAWAMQPAAQWALAAALAERQAVNPPSIETSPSRTKPRWRLLKWLS